MNQLTFENICYKSYPKDILCNINLEFKQGINGILGKNGAGKSTLLKLLTRVLAPSSGWIKLNEVLINKIPRKVLSQLIAFVPQAPSLTFNFTVEELLMMGLYCHSKSKVESENCVNKALTQVDGLHLKKRFLAELSVGERQRIYLARALVVDSPILLLDEPTSSLDVYHQLQIWKLLGELKNQGRLILIALHDLHAAERFCDHLILLDKGHVKATGPYAKISSIVHTTFYVMESKAQKTAGYDLIPKLFLK